MAICVVRWRIAGLAKRSSSARGRPRGRSRRHARASLASSISRLDEGPEGRLAASASATVLVARERAKVGERRMAAVEQPQLHALEGRDVGDEVGADPLPGRPRPPAKRSSITHCRNGSATTGAASSSAERARRARAMSASVVAGTMRSTMVAGEGDLGLDPAARARRRAAQRTPAPRRAGPAVVREVVAAEDGERRPGRAARAAQARDQRPTRRARRSGCRGRGRFGIAGVQRPGRRTWR